MKTQRCILNLTSFSTPSLFRHKKDSGGWSIYTRKELFTLNCILDIIFVAYLNTISTVHVSFVGSDKKKRKRWSSRRFQTGRAMSNFMEVPRTE